MSQVRDIIDAIKHRLPDRANIYPALNTAVRTISKRLKFHDSSMIKGELSITVTADSSSGTVPTDYWGMLERPYVSGEIRTLTPIPNQRTKLLYTDNTTPQWYEIIDRTINLYPGTSSEITLKGAYWKKETQLTKLTDTMPFSEMFDDAIQESLVRTYPTGESMGSFIIAAVDEMVPGLEKRSATRITQAVNYDAMMWDQEMWY